MSQSLAAIQACLNFYVSVQQIIATPCPRETRPKSSMRSSIMLQIVLGTRRSRHAVTVGCTNMRICALATASASTLHPALWAKVARFCSSRRNTTLRATNDVLLTAWSAFGVFRLPGQYVLAKYWLKLASTSDVILSVASKVVFTPSHIPVSWDGRPLVLLAGQPEPAR